jgi:hypothetical protein
VSRDSIGASCARGVVVKSHHKSGWRSSGLQRPIVLGLGVGARAVTRVRARRRGDGRLVEACMEDGDAMQDGVRLAVASAQELVATGHPRGGRDRRGEPQSLARGFTEVPGAM